MVLQQARLAVRKGRASWRWLFTLLLLFLDLRLLQAACARTNFDKEEGYTITAAWELLNHNIWDYQIYQISDTESGSLLTVALSVPFCWLFGPSLLSLKLTAIVISGITLTGLYMLCRDLFGLRTAMAVGLLYILSAPPIYAYSMTAHGFHPDSMAVQVFFLWGICTCFTRQATPRRFFGVGILGGFAVYFAYISVMAVVAAVMVWLWRRLRHKATHRFYLLPFTTGVGVGLVPFFIYNALNNFRGMSTYHGTLSSYLFSSMPLSEKLVIFLDTTLKRLIHFSSLDDYCLDAFIPYPHHPAYDYLFWITAMVALLSPFVLWVRWRLRRSSGSTPPRILFFDQLALVFFLITITIFFTSAHPIYPWHMVPMLVVLVVLVGARLGQLWTGGGLVRRALAGLVFIAAISYGLYYNIRDIRLEWFGVSAVIDGRSYPQFFQRVTMHFLHEVPTLRRDAALELEEGLPYELADVNIELPTKILAVIMDAKKPREKIQELLEAKSVTKVRFDRHRTAGRALAMLVRRNKLNLDQALAFIATFDEHQASRAMQEMGSLGGRFFFGEFRQAMAQHQQYPKGWLNSFAYGAGRSEYLLQLEPPQALCSTPDLDQDPSLRKPFFKGVGYATALRTVKPLPQIILERICPRMLPYFIEGAATLGKPSPWPLPHCGVLEK